MKILFLSDIHGSAHYTEKAAEAFHQERADYMAFLGDVLYHGPRNSMPENYNPPQTAEILNRFKHNLIAVKGNCDSEVDQLMLAYPMMADYSIILADNRKIFLTHGHLFHPDHLPPLSEGDILAFGHTHIPVAEKQNGIYIFNPGSVSLPKEHYPNSYGIYDGNQLMVKDFSGQVVRECRLS